MSPDHLSSLKLLWSTAFFLLILGASVKVAYLPFLLLPLFFLSCWAELHSVRESQSWDFDDIGACWACCGLDARSWRKTWGWGWPPLWWPVEAIPIRGQSRWCRKADDCRGDPAALAVDPAVVIGFQVEVRTTIKGNRAKMTSLSSPEPLRPWGTGFQSLKTTVRYEHWKSLGWIFAH